jgi:predicted alpha/beta hydrolase family esterase
MKAMIVPGNNNTDVSEIWIPYVKKSLEALGITVIAKNMPDAKLSRKQYWLPFIEAQVGDDPEVILIGHSSGAVAVLRYLENHSILGAIIIGAYDNDFGYENEKKSGYFDSEWHWEQIKKHTKWIIQFASTSDPYIPISNAHKIRDKLQTTYYEYPDQGHFSDDVNKIEFPELIDALKKKI